MPYDRNSSSYDAQNNLTQKTLELWNDTLSQWGNFSKEVYEYDANNNNAAVESFSNWNENANYYATRIRWEYICTQIVGSINNNIKVNATLIYPNPIIAGNKLQINTTETVSFTLVDITGIIIETGNFQQGENTLNTYNLHQGLYFLKIYNEVHRIILCSKLSFL